MLEKAFRSLIDIPKNGRPTIDKEELVENFRSFQKAQVRYEHDVFKKIYYRILDHFKRYTELPCFDLLRDHFQEEPGCEAVIVTLDQILVEKPYIGGNYKAVLREIKATQDLEALQEALSETNEIAVKGRTVGKAVLKGCEQALDYFANRSKEIRAQSMEFKTESQILESKEIQDHKKKYEEREKNQLSTLGIYTGLRQIDEALGGIRHTELWIVAAYTGQGKTTFSVNVLYRAIYSGWDSAMVTLEMTVEEMQTMVYVLHTSNMEVWAGTPYEQYVGLIQYNDALEGRLPPELKEFYFAALDDLESNEDYGRLYIIQPDKTTFTVDDVNVKCLEVNSDLKTKGRKLEFLVVDYLRLLTASGKTRDERQDLNAVILGMKRLLLTFNNGQGLRGLTPHQIKREGYVRALANGGMYLLSDLSDSSEIEKSADAVLTLFMDDLMRKSQIFKVCNLKARRSALFAAFEACANLATKYIFSRADIKPSDFVVGGTDKLVLTEADL